ncbi:unnamed protein product [Triticum turgidum subsp. durum]|uniref:Uncharacterized protein n=1 Tax=Triticum turgidum subsp. durum TaxID=4567 RepID=A0A9R0YU19_TRITD|nr:unnamed protein product [Triticum turgidum subsp. durum]
MLQACTTVAHTIVASWSAPVFISISAITSPTLIAGERALALGLDVDVGEVCAVGEEPRAEGKECDSG